MHVYEFEDKYNALDDDFRDYLKGKRVAIIGRAALDNLEQGEWIDSHDVVVRVHQVIPYEGYTVPAEAPRWEYPPFVPIEWQSRIGSKCSVFYHKEFHPPNFSGLVTAFNEAGGRFLCHEYLENLWSYSCVEIRKMAPCRYLTNDHFLNVMEVVGDLPYAGSLIIGDLLRHDIKSLYFTGFPTMYQADGTLLPDEWIQQNKYMNFMNINWLRSLWRTYDDITTDSNMESLFQLLPEEWEREQNERTQPS